MDRVYRFGQERDVRIVRFVTGAYFTYTHTHTRARARFTGTKVQILTSEEVVCDRGHHRGAHCGTAEQEKIVDSRRQQGRVRKKKSNSQRCIAVTVSRMYKITSTSSIPLTVWFDVLAMSLEVTPGMCLELTPELTCHFVCVCAVGCRSREQAISGCSSLESVDAIHF